MKPDDIDTEKLVQYTARKAIGQARFLASALEKYKTVEKLDDTALASHFGLDTGQLARLALCLRPVPDTPRFRADVERICQKFGVAPAKLVSLLRRVAAYEISSAPTTGVLMAARDYEPDEGDQYQVESNNDD
jgi:hypothetical protein